MGNYNYDPELAPLIPMLPVESDWSDMDSARAMMQAMIASIPVEAGPADEVVRYEDRTISGLPGAPEVTVRVYDPFLVKDTRPGLLYIHGGGFCFGSVETEHAGALSLAHSLGAVVVSVDYRLAPEHPFPAGLDDCYAALVWFADQAQSLNVDPQRIAVSGQSAGGGLSAGLALMARDKGGPHLCFQFLGIPELDYRLETPSMLTFVDTPLWNRPNAIMSWRCYLGENPGNVSPYASPAVAPDLKGLPPAFVTTMEFDPLRDEGIEYAMRLLAAGVSVELHQYPGTFHGSSFVTTAAVSRRANSEMVEALRRGLAAKQG